MIEDLESELTVTPKGTPNTDNLEVAEEANVDEDITAEDKASSDTKNDFKEGKKTKSYKEK